MNCSTIELGSTIKLLVFLPKPAPLRGFSILEKDPSSCSGPKFHVHLNFSLYVLPVLPTTTVAKPLVASSPYLPLDHLLTPSPPHPLALPLRLL